MAAHGRRVLLQSLVIFLVHATGASDSLENDNIELSRVKRAAIEPPQNINPPQNVINNQGGMKFVQPPVINNVNQQNVQQGGFQPNLQPDVNQHINNPMKFTNRIQDSFQRPKQDAQPLKRTGKKHSFKLAEVSECREDVQRLCSSTSQKNNFAIMDCLQKDVKVKFTCSYLQIAQIT